MIQTEIDFDAGSPVAGDLDVRWIHGVPRGRPASGPPIQVHGYDQHTYMLRQSKTTSYEAPFPQARPWSAASWPRSRSSSASPAGPIRSCRSTWAAGSWK